MDSGIISYHKKMKIFFAGDFCSRPSTAPIKVSDELRSLVQSCDFKVVNFEVPLKPEGISLPSQKRERFYQHDDSPDFLRGLGFNLFQLANNHAFDWGEAGLLKTKKALGKSSFGTGTYDEAYQVKVVEKEGMRVGFLALSFAAYAGVFNDVMNHDGVGCAFINDLKVNHVIIDAKKSVDYLFVLPHDGIEYIDIPLPETIARYRDFIDYGADGVIGTHPHCPQGWEQYKGKPIFYSLGNFLFNSKEGYDYRANDRPHWYEGLCVVLAIEDGTVNWSVVNVRNVDNTCILVDHSDERVKHNDQVCRYLTDKKEYLSYLDAVCDKIGYGDLLSIIDKSVHPHHLKMTAKSVLRMCGSRLKGKRAVNDQQLIRLLSHDCNRMLLNWSLKRHSIK